LTAQNGEIIVSGSVCVIWGKRGAKVQEWRWVDGKNWRKISFGQRFGNLGKEGPRADEWRWVDGTEWRNDSFGQRLCNLGKEGGEGAGLSVD
jgi:hypothetical protein